MTRVLRSSCIALLLAAAPTWADELHEEQLIQPVPSGYVLVHHEDQDGVNMAVFAPQDESDGMLAFTIVEGVMHDAESFIQRIRDKPMTDCPKGKINLLDEGMENGYAASSWTFTCPDPQENRYAYSWNKAIIGQHYVYLMRQTFNARPDVRQVKLTEELLRKVNVCDPRTKEHPCPVEQMQVSDRSSNPPTEAICLALTDVNNELTPAQLFASTQACLAVKDYDRAARLNLLARVYGRVDASRVADRSAHEVIPALQFTSYQQVPDTDKEIIAKRMSALVSDSAQLKAVCTSIKSIGPPAYYPDYMINHGMAMFKSNRGPALVDGFDMQKSWQQTLNEYLKCP